MPFRLSIDKTGKDQAKAHYANAFIGFAVQRPYRGPIAASGNMTYSFSQHRRDDVHSLSTLQAIIQSERTATTRYDFHKTIAYWSKLNPGDVVKWKGTDDAFAFVEVTKGLQKLSPDTNPESWSIKEGWSVQYFHQHVKPRLQHAYQFEYKPTALSSTGIYLKDARQQDIPVNHNIKPGKQTIAFVSVSSEGHYNQPTIQLASHVMQYGGAVVMDKPGTGFGQSHSSFNRHGEGFVQDALTRRFGSPRQTPEGYNYWGTHLSLEKGISQPQQRQSQSHPKRRDRGMSF